MIEKLDDGGTRLVFCCPPSLYLALRVDQRHPTDQ